MNDFHSREPFGKQRQTFAPTPSYRKDDDAVQADAPSQDTAKQKGLQADAAPMQADAPASKPVSVEPATTASDPSKNFTVSVDEIRLRLHSLGIQKSKDTIQRYCREGHLDCDRLGLMRRYFATERSVEALIKKLQKDADATNSTQVHAGVSIRDLNQNKNTQADASNSTQVHAGESEVLEDKETKGESAEEGTKSEAGAVSQVVDLLHQQIDTLKEERDFLREELKDRRKQADALQDVISGMKVQSEANLLNAKMQADNQQSDGRRKSYTATIVDDEVGENREGDNPQSSLGSDGV